MAVRIQAVSPELVSAKAAGAASERKQTQSDGRAAAGLQHGHGVLSGLADFAALPKD